MPKLLLVVLFLLSSCALFKKAPSLKEAPLYTVLESFRMTGEGRGRLGLEQNQYVFSYEAVLRDQDTWLLAASIPLHGEEVMLLTDLRSPVAGKSTPESFERRLQREIDQRLSGKEVSGKRYVRELRSMVRFLLAAELGLSLKCISETDSIHVCSIGEEKLLVEVEDARVRVKKNISATHELVLVGENLTDSFFGRTNFLLSSKKDQRKASPVMSLELFWN